MFKKKKRQQQNESYVRAMRWDAMEKSLMVMARDIDDLRQSINNKRLAQADAREMNALTAMVGELARRLDLANIADLPAECKCEACGCNNVKELVPRAIATPRITSLDAYCVKCKEKRPLMNMKIKTSDSGRQMAQGICPVCNTKMNRILGKVTS